MLELVEVRKTYSGARQPIRAVDGVSLELSPGEMVALQGPSGSGKTTLLMLVAAFLRPDGGTIRYEGRELSAFNEQQASEYQLRDVGFLRQRFRLAPRVSAVENAAGKLLLGGVGLREARARAVPWLERMGLGDRLDHPPERLSGGECQRVALARTLAGEPRLILADEPTGQLDSAGSREIMRLLHSIATEREAAVLLVTHDLDAASLADRRFTLRDGRLHAHGAAGSHHDGEPSSQPASTSQPACTPRG
jgi:putative ABC transport system ATP-binding protein